MSAFVRLAGIILVAFALASTQSRADTIASLTEDVQSRDSKRLDGWSFKWNPTGVDLGNAAKYEDLVSGRGDFFRIAEYPKTTDNFANAVVNKNKIEVYDRKGDGGWWLVSGASAETSTDGLDHYLILGYTIQEGEAGDLQVRTSGGNSAPSKLRFYVNERLVEQQDFPDKLGEEISVDLGNLNVGDTVSVAFAADSSRGRNLRRWYGNVQISKRAVMKSYDTGYTIQKVRTAQRGSETIIVGSSYDGEIVALSYEGNVLWTMPLSGYMVHDLWCADITGDGIDEIMVANADGTVYCMDAKGTKRWRFTPNESHHLPPMYAVCAVRSKDGTPYVVCGGFDKNIYYVSAAGKLVKTLESYTYSVDQPWGAERRFGKGHIANFLRPIPQPGSGNRYRFIWPQPMQSTPLRRSSSTSTNRRSFLKTLAVPSSVPTGETRRKPTSKTTPIGNGLTVG